MNRDALHPTNVRRLFTRSVLVPSALLGVLAAVFFGLIFCLLSVAKRVDRCNEVIGKANLLLRLLVDGETGMRGYLITGAPVFLEPYHVEESSSGPVFDGMIKLVSDRPDQVQRLVALRRAHVEWQGFARKTIDLRKNGGDYAAPVRNHEGKRRMDAMREQSAAFIQLEGESRDTRTRAARRAAWVVAGVSFGLTCLLAVVLAAFTRRQVLVASANSVEALSEAESQRTSTRRLESLHEIDRTIPARRSAFVDEHLHVAEETVGQLSIAIQQSRLPEQLQRNGSDLEQIVHGRTGELQETLEGVLQRRQTVAKSDARIETLEQNARDLARFVETTRQQTLLLSDKKTEALEQKARDLADFVESLRNQTRLQSETEIDALGQKARDLALSVEAVRKETRLNSETEIAALGQKARDLAVSVETVREEALLQSDTEIAALGKRARDLAVSVETQRKETRLNSETEIAALGQKARDLAVSVETVREEALLQSDSEIAALGQQARDLAVSVETEREQTFLHSDAEIKALNQRARSIALSVEKSRLETLMESDKAIRKLNEELEQRVLERTGQLEAANKELESFSYSVSHDLRAPLRAIDGFSRIVLEDFAAPLPAEAKSYLNLVRDNTRQMGQLVDDLLAFSGLGRQALAKHTVEPDKLVRLCLAEMKKEQEGRQLEIVIGDLPSCQADPTLLKQVWMNLLSNALKYTRKREAACIEIGCRMEPRLSGPGTEAIYFVKDNGAGFDMKYAHKLFGVFQRLHRAADYDGTGVGLAIVQRIINRHGGRVWGEAQLNKGATFSFTLA